MQTYLINDRPLSVHATAAAECTFEANKNYLFDLTHLGVLTIEGAKAATFLQSQVSADIRKVTPDNMQQGILCSLQGRILALLDIVDWQGLQLILPTDLLAITETTLDRPARLSRLTFARPNFSILGFYYQNPASFLHNFPLPTDLYQLVHTPYLACYKIDEELYILITTPKSHEHLLASFHDTESLRGALAWHSLNMQKRHPAIYKDTSGAFLPHRLNLHKQGFISFDKGCYKGQEIIARTHYKAKEKYELVKFNTQGTQPIASSLRIFDEDGSVELGKIVDYAPDGAEGFIILASLLINRPQNIRIEGHEKSFRLF